MSNFFNFSNLVSRYCEDLRYKEEKGSNPSPLVLYSLYRRGTKTKHAGSNPFNSQIGILAISHFFEASIDLMFSSLYISHYPSIAQGLPYITNSFI